MVKKNPSVFKDWKTPLEIKGYVECEESPITHLSKHLIFSGRNKAGNTADFFRCKNLQIATGTFNGLAYFVQSGIKKIKELSITQPNTNGWAANFFLCPNLKIATGNYPGLVNFRRSGIQKIKNLHIQNPDPDGIFVLLSDCENLNNLKDLNLEQTLEIEPEKLAREKERRAVQQFFQKTQPKKLPFL